MHLGNHARDHAILTNCTPEEMANQIETCQAALEDMVGYRPIVIAYPNGNCSPSGVNAALNAGLRLGFTVAPHRTQLPLTESTRMTLGRFLFLVVRTFAANAACFPPDSFPARRSRT